MKRKLLLITIGILAMSAAACKADDTTNKTDTQEEVNIKEPESDDTKEDSEKDSQEQNRKNTYRDVDIKIPSIKEE